MWKQISGGLERRGPWTRAGGRVEMSGTLLTSHAIVRGPWMMSSDVTFLCVGYELNNEIGHRSTSPLPLVL